MWSSNSHLPHTRLLTWQNTNTQSIIIWPCTGIESFLHHHVCPTSRDEGDFSVLRRLKTSLLRAVDTWCSEFPFHFSSYLSLFAQTIALLTKLKLYYLSLLMRVLIVDTPCRSHNVMKFVMELDLRITHTCLILM